MHETPPSTERTGAVRGDTIGEYVIERAVGDGTTGQVVAARSASGELVAIKIAHTTHPETAARFKRAGRAMMALESPHIVQVNEVTDTREGLPCMVMEWLEGQHLGAELEAEGVLAIEDVVRWMLQVCTALNEAHDTRVFHRDLKPENLFLANVRDERVIRVVDFGFAPPFPHLGPAEKRTRPGALAGTSPYLAPEQIQKGEVDARTDVWGVGACLFRLLTNRHPFSGANLGDVAANILSEHPADVGALRPDVPEALEAVVARCLQKDPRQRFGNMRDLEDALVAALGDGRSTPVVELGGQTLEDLRSTPQVTRVAMPFDEVTDVGSRATPMTFRTVVAQLDAPTIVGDAPTATDNRAPVHVTPVKAKSAPPRKSVADSLPPISFHSRAAAKPLARPPRRAEVPSTVIPAEEPVTGLTTFENIVEIEEVVPISSSDRIETTIQSVRDDFPSQPFTPLALPGHPQNVSQPAFPQPMLAAPRATAVTPPQPLAIAPLPGGPALPMLGHMPTPTAFPTPGPPPYLGPPTPASFPAPQPWHPGSTFGSQPVPLAAMSSGSLPVAPGSDSMEVAIRRGAVTTVKKRPPPSSRGALIAFTVAFLVALGGGALYVFRYSSLADSLGTRAEPSRTTPPKKQVVPAPVVVAPTAPASTIPPAPTAAPAPSVTDEPEPEPATEPATSATATHRPRPAPTPRPAGEDILNKRK